MLSTQLLVLRNCLPLQNKGRASYFYSYCMLLEYIRTLHFCSLKSLLLLHFYQSVFYYFINVTSNLIIISLRLSTLYNASCIYQLLYYTSYILRLCQNYNYVKTCYYKHTTHIISAYQYIRLTTLFLLNLSATFNTELLNTHKTKIHHTYHIFMVEMNMHLTPNIKIRF